MATTALALDFGGHSVAGVKAENQDAFGAYSAKGDEAYYKGFCAVIADGVSICDRAAEASQLATTNFINDYYSTPDTWTVKDSAARVLHSLNSWMYQQGAGQASQYSEMVTTFSGVIFKSTTAHILQAGDSSVWRLRAGKLERLTRAHVSQRKQGDSLLTRALGMDLHLEADYQQTELQKGDLFILLTDGVEGFLNPSRLEELLNLTYLSLEQMAQRLVSEASLAGSDDNLSCLLCRVTNTPNLNLDEIKRASQQRVIPPVLEPGNTIDGYQVDQVLYSGTRSHLYVVSRQSDAQQLVLKAPSANFSDETSLLEAFMREEWIGQKLNHKHVMRVLDKDHDTRLLYNLYEYLPAQDLAQWILDNPAPSLLKVRKIAQQICSGLRAFQRQSMIHRDLKPENIMIDGNGFVKLIDFGTVKVNGLAEISDVHDASAPVGSVNYIAPEYLMGYEGNFRSDIFSLGVICYEMLTGELPFKAMSGRHIPNHYRAWEYQSIRSHRADIPNWVDGALKKACSPNPAQRYEAISEFFFDFTRPNNNLIESTQTRSFYDREPIRFWQFTCVLLVLANLVSLYFLAL